MAGAGFWPLFPLQVESWGWPVLWLFASGIGTAGPPKGKARGCYPPLLYAEGSLGLGWAGVSTSQLGAQQRMGKSHFQVQCPFHKAPGCIRM